ncbi:MAG TPA: pilus assembly protein PilM [Victivallales bacterium]|nr:pilus assembly protein PilM [Victivallales bacterium]HRR28837.1 pilus assembly protein PilM [Victivallales bacterium]
MNFFKKSRNRVIGLDIGSGSIKALELKEEQDNISISSLRRLKLRAEGILDEEELSHSLSAWLNQANWKNLDVCIGLPQYISTVQVRDFPPVNEEALKDMIAYETTQLSGISEESFIYDYYVMPPKLSRKNPVLIGISREKLVFERLKILDRAGVIPSDVTMNSTALVNALFFLHPEIKNVDSLQIILDIGAENSIVIIFAGTQILSINSLSFGAEKFTKAIAETRGLDITKSEEEKAKLKIDFTKKDDSMTKVANLLLAELNNVIEQWRQHESPDFAEKEIMKIWLSGGGAETGGLLDFIRVNYRGVQVEIFGIGDSQKSIQPDLNTALGLALQSTGKASVKISLAPEHIRWTARIKKNFHYLSAALFFLSISLFFFLSALYFTFKAKDNVNRITIMRLNKCAELIPQIDKISEDILHHEKMLLPVVSKANNSAKILAALNEISSAKEENLFPIFICDEDTYNSVSKQQEGNQTNSIKKASFIFMDTKQDSSSSESAANQSLQLNVTQVKEIKSIILFGLTLSSGKNEHYEMVRRFQLQLSKSNLFGGNGKELDILPETNFSQKEAIISEWNNRIINNREVYSVIGKMRFRDFTMKIPFKETCINSSVLSNTTEKQKK